MPRDVVVIGAGPVGLALAAELASREVDVEVIDQTDGSVTFPAGEAIFSRTMEHLRRWGVADRARREALPPADYPHRVVFMTQIAGYLLAAFDIGATNLTPGEYAAISPEGPAFFSKYSFLPLLRTAATEAGATITYGTRVDGVEQHDDGVVVSATDLPSGEQRSRTAAYAVACEGGRSSIRSRLGIPFDGDFAQGSNFAIHFRAPQLLKLLVEHANGPAVQIQTMASHQRPYVTVVNGTDQWRLSAYVQQTPTADQARRLVIDSIGADIEVEILSAQPWSGHRVVARSYRDGRIFLAGDAAHLLWPKGGFGANTGIGDAVDLGWKLAAVLQGWGGPRLLDSYEPERRPIAVRNVSAASANWSADVELASGPHLLDDGPEGVAARAAAGAEIMRLRSAEYNVTGVQLGYRYANSPIVVPDGVPEPPDEPGRYVPTTWPGARAPHAWLPDGSSTLDHFGDGFTLVAWQAGDTKQFVTASQRLGVPLHTLIIDKPEIRALYEVPLVLVRPDGHVCWRGDGRSPDPRNLPDSVLAVVAGLVPADLVPATWTRGAVRR